MYANSTCQKTLFCSHDLSLNTFLMYANSVRKPCSVPMISVQALRIRMSFGVCRQSQKTLFCSYDLSSNTLWTHPSASYFITLTFLLIALMRMLSGMVVMTFYSKTLNSLHSRAAKFTLPDASIASEAKIQRLGLLSLTPF